MHGLTVTEYDHFVSFSLDRPNGERMLVQYARHQVWRDATGTWQVAAAAKPFYSWYAAPPPAPAPRICPAIAQALAEAAASAAYGIERPAIASPHLPQLP